MNTLQFIPQMISNGNLKLIEAIVIGSNKILDNSGISWEDKFELIFHNASLLKLLDVHFEYHDPDTSYEDDVRAYMSGLNDWFSKQQ